MKAMLEKERNKRNGALYLFLSYPENLKTAQEIIKDNGSYFLSNLHYDRDWDKIMKAIEKIGTLKRTAIPSDCDDPKGEFIITRAEITLNRGYLEAYFAKKKKWQVLKGKDIIWHSYNVYIKDAPDASNSYSYQEAIWKTVTDFALLWCKMYKLKV